MIIIKNICIMEVSLHRSLIKLQVVKVYEEAGRRLKLCRIQRL